MINDFVKLLQLWRQETIWGSLHICLQNSSMSVFVCEEGLGDEQKMWHLAIRGPRQWSIVSLGTEGWQWWRMDVPPRRPREGRLWKPPVSRWYAYALNTDGCRVVSGMCQEAWINFDISEITFMVHFYRLLRTINFTRSSVEWHSCSTQDLPELGLGG